MIRLRSAASLGLVVLAALVSLVATVALYARQEVVNREAFADRALAALEDDGVRAVVRAEIVDGLIDRGSGDLIAARPLLESVVDAVIDSRPFRTVFRRAALEANRVFFVRENENAIMDISDAATLVRFGMRSVSPKVAAKLPGDIDSELAARRRRDFAGQSLALAEHARVLGIGGAGRRAAALRGGGRGRARPHASSPVRSDSARCGCRKKICNAHVVDPCAESRSALGEVLGCVPEGRRAVEPPCNPPVCTKWSSRSRGKVMTSPHLRRSVRPKMGLPFRAGGTAGLATFGVRHYRAVGGHAAPCRAVAGGGPLRRERLAESGARDWLVHRCGAALAPPRVVLGDSVGGYACRRPRVQPLAGLSATPVAPGTIGVRTTQKVPPPCPKPPGTSSPRTPLIHPPMTAAKARKRTTPAAAPSRTKRPSRARTTATAKGGQVLRAWVRTLPPFRAHPRRYGRRRGDFRGNECPLAVTRPLCPGGAAARGA